MRPVAPDNTYRLRSAPSGQSTTVQKSTYGLPFGDCLVQTTMNQPPRPQFLSLLSTLGSSNWAKPVPDLTVSNYRGSWSAAARFRLAPGRRRSACRAAGWFAFAASIRQHAVSTSEHYFTDSDLVWPRYSVNAQVLSYQLLLRRILCSD